MGSTSVIAAASATFATVLAGAAPASAAPGDSPRVAAVKAYMDSILTRDVSGVRLTPDAKRFENGIQTGFSGPQLKTDLRTGLQYSFVRRYREVKIVEHGEYVDVTLLLDFGLNGHTWATTYISETFTVPHDEISLITISVQPA